MILNANIWTYEIWMHEKVSFFLRKCIMNTWNHCLSFLFLEDMKFYFFENFFCYYYLISTFERNANESIYAWNFIW